MPVCAACLPREVFVLWQVVRRRRQAGGWPRGADLQRAIDLPQAIIDEYRGKPNELGLPVWASWRDQQMLDHITRVAVVAKDVEPDLRSWLGELRRRGVMWSRIGIALGITRQSASERFSGD